jgi:hypothetical protein
MTSRDLLRLVLRRWYLMVLGAMLSLALLSVVWRAPGVYWTQFDVVLLEPTSRLNPNSIEDPRFSMAPMAGVMVTDVNGDHRVPVLASPDTTLYGEGLREGTRVRVPNTGSQWLPLYSQPRIDVQVVSRDPALVERRAQDATARLRAVLDRRQDELAVGPRVRMSTITSPRDPIIAHVTGNRSRAALGTALLGATLTTLAVCLLERLRIRRRSHARSLTVATSD